MPKHLHIAIAGFIILIVACFCITLPAIAQNDTIPAQKAKHAVFVELGGVGNLYSVNYERVFDGRYSLRGGIAAYPDFLGSSLFIYPVAANYLVYINTSSYAEIGIGGALMVSEFDKPTLIYSPSIGFRNQNLLKSGFVGRMTFMPYIKDGKFGFFPGASMGYGF